jgi:HEAT repeat protein
MSQPRSGTPPPAQSPAVSSVAMLSREVADFLVEFSIVLHKRVMYPLGHPHLQQSASRFVDRVETLLQLRENLVVGVARHQLILGGVATDPRNALLSDLARRLHRHRVATLRFDRGIHLAEIDALLGELSADPLLGDGPLGLRPTASVGWTHLQIHPPELNRLLLEDDDSVPDDAGNPERELWQGLANLAMSADSDLATGEEDPLLVARAIDSQSGQVAYDRVVLDYLGQMNEEMSGRHGAWEPRVRERVSRLVASLKPETLRRVLEAGADHAERQRFALTAAEVLTVDAVVEVVEAAAKTTGQTISHHLLRMLHKFAHYAEHGEPDTRVEAEATLRKDVARLVAGWELEDPNPSAYTAVLDGMARQSPADSGIDSESMACEPESVLQIGLEIGSLGPRVYEALDTLVENRQLARVAELLETAPIPETSDALWQHVATAGRFHAELAARPIDFRAVEGLAKRLGTLVVEPLLDLLESSTDRATRSRVLRILSDIGPQAAGPAAQRLANASWYIQRNMLTLLRRLHTWPPGFSAVPYACHSDARVRHEAYKLLLEFPQHRASATVHGLKDADDGVVSLVLRAAMDSCPGEAHRAIERFIADGRRSPEVRALAVRVLARHSGPEALPRFLKLVGTRRTLLGWRLEPKSPVVLAALTALARYWTSHPQAAAVLVQARQHADPDFRVAARMRHA